MPRVAFSSSVLARATCPSIACSRFGPNTTSPSNSMNSISVPKPTVHSPVKFLLVGNGDRCDDWLLFLSFHGRREAADALSNSFTELGKFLGPEHEQGNSENNQ